MWIGDSDLLQLRPRRHAEPLRLRPRRRADRAAHATARPGTCAGPATTARAASSTRLNGELQVYDIADASRARRSGSTCPTTASAMRPRADLGRRTHRGLRLSPKGERALFVARGDVFTRADREGPDAQPDPQLRRARQVGRAGRPTAAKIAFISDRSGEEEIYLVDQDGQGEPEQLTDGGEACATRRSGRRTASDWPSATRTASSTCWTWRREAGRGVADDSTGQVRRLRLVAARRAPGVLALSDDNGFSSIYIWSVADGKTAAGHRRDVQRVQPGLGPRRQLPVLPQRPGVRPADRLDEWNFAVDRETGIFALALRKDVAHPSRRRATRSTLSEDDDEEGRRRRQEGREGQEGRRGREGRPQKPGSSRSTSRAWPTAWPASRSTPTTTAVSPRSRDICSTCAAARSTTAAAATWSRALQIFSLEEREEKTLAEDVGGYALSRGRHEGARRSSGRLQALRRRTRGRGREQEASPPPG